MTKICLIATNEHEAYNYAKSQYLEKEQWFYAKDVNDLLFRGNFHVIVVGMPGLHMPSSYFEKLYSLARERGKIGRL